MSRRRKKKSQSIEIIRNYDCERYDKCLTIVAKLDKQFTCLNCIYYRKVTILHELHRNTAG